MFNYGRGNRMRGYRRILSLLSVKSMSEFEIIQTLNCLPTNLKQNLVNAQSLGYIEKKEDVYSLTEAGLNYDGIKNDNLIDGRMHRNVIYGPGRVGVGRTMGRGRSGQFRGF
jgi:hypothetical protein